MLYIAFIIQATSVLYFGKIEGPENEAFNAVHF